jgi:GDP-4-dehydro-6-deoxy-D-mannose reductase
MRPFNHTGPGQAPHFVCADFARQLIEVERGERPARVDVGDLDVVRDFGDVRDVVRAYVAAYYRGERGAAYNVCSGVGRTPRAVLHTLMEISGIHAAVAVDAQRQRPVEVPALVGSAATLHAATGWSPAISWEQTLRDVLEDWRMRMRS